MKILIIFLLPVLAWGNCGNSVNDFCRVKVERVYDGDTFFVAIPKLHNLFRNNLGVRVKGIDTPELRSGSKYEKAAAKLAKAETILFLGEAKRVDLKGCVKGKYFRIVCDVFADGESLAKRLIVKNLAVEAFR